MPDATELYEAYCKVNDARIALEDLKAELDGHKEWALEAKVLARIVRALELKIYRAHQRRVRA